MKKKREIQFRDFKNISITSNETEGKKVISGFLPYNERSVNMGFYEYLCNGCMNKTLSDGADVRALINHDSSQLIGRVSNGSLKLESREDGLYAECTLPSTSYADDLYTLIAGGYNTNLSFGFNIIKEDYGYEEGVETHYLREIALIEISWGVSFPAYESTQATIVRGIDLSNLGKTLGKEELSEDDIKEVKNTIEELNKLLPKEEEKEDNTTSADEQITEADEDEDLKFLQEKLEEIKSLLNE